MYNLSNSNQFPWLKGEDFTVTTYEEENLGGLPVTEAEVRDYNHCIRMG